MEKKIIYFDVNVPENEKAKEGEECCGWCERPITGGVKVGNIWYHLCQDCFEKSKKGMMPSWLKCEDE